MAASATSNDNLHRCWRKSLIRKCQLGVKTREKTKRKLMKNNESRRRLLLFFPLADTQWPPSAARFVLHGVSSRLAPAQLLKDTSAEQMLPVTMLQVATFCMKDACLNPLLRAAVSATTHMTPQLAVAPWKCSHVINFLVCSDSNLSGGLNYQDLTWNESRLHCLHETPLFVCFFNSYNNANTLVCWLFFHMLWMWFHLCGKREQSAS